MKTELENGYMSDEPLDAVSRIANEMLAAAERAAEDEGSPEFKAIVLLHLENGPGGESDSCVASHGIEDGEELFQMLVTHLRATAQAVGIDMAVMPMFGPEDRKEG